MSDFDLTQYEYQLIAERDRIRARLSEAKAILARVAKMGPPQGTREKGVACACCDMGDAGYASRGDGFHDDDCVTKDAQLFLAQQEKSHDGK